MNFISSQVYDMHMNFGSNFFCCSSKASNSIAPAYECLELGIGDSILQKAVGEAYGTKTSKSELKYALHGCRNISDVNSVTTRQC